MRMYATLMAWAALCFSGGLCWGAEQQFPYTAYVAADDVYVRSGPGRNYYPTLNLEKDTPLQVWRHDPGGWLAIRPPEDSFSWISSRYLRPLSKQLGVITGDDVVSRVGSRLSNVRDVIQVRLQRGERVQILEQDETAGENWYRIAPPAGEFRWISSRFVTKHKPHNGISAPDRRARIIQEGVQHSAESEVISIAGEQDYAIGAIGADDEHSGDVYHGATHLSAERSDDAAAESAETRYAATAESLRAARTARAVNGGRNEQRPAGLQTIDAADVVLVPVDEERDEHFVTEESRDRKEGEISLAQYTSAGRPRLPSGRSYASRPQVAVRGRRVASLPSRDATRPVEGHLLPRRQLTADEFSQALADAELQLSQMVAEEPTVWEFAELEQYLTELLDRSATALQRGEARRLLYRIRAFEDIQRRHQRVSRVMDETDQRNALLERSTARNPGSSDQRSLAAAPFARINIDPTAEFDGRGILKPVISKRSDAPRFALVNDLGEVTSFVTPAPGVNLQPYVGQQVGMNGTRGFIPELRKSHVMVKRVTLLEQR